MTAITVIGTGNMGQAIAGIAAKGGASVQILARDLEKAGTAAASVGATAGVVGDAISGEIVVLAVPHPALAELAETYGDQLANKVVVDITNPVDFATFDGLVVPADSSAAGELAALIPGAKVVKAFNTNFAATLAAGELGGEPTVVQIAGDDESAKNLLAGVITAAGLKVADAGALKRARELEALGFLQMVLAVREQIGWTGGYAVRA
ncbi:MULTISPECIES: NAD(P)-binding domain-containing protein [unclassified Microbacterium]|uniref:NADPH-dependent F420 reductase n=1 Tax=unclassified Microbacterium TaxID=2609290 RepID=UPI001DB72380|nr:MULTISPECIES: NAD(P)-binding domain-containing protein [unclassified Microbacterium]CAH0152050.1 Pyrroline-5-carboxylate reductase [Microbacterium sp. Bi121]HWK78663.1 NAD(P)-binding domain-containing protein [Microbacterium sp.]